jgi:hypothetical protein
VKGESGYSDGCSLLYLESHHFKRTTLARLYKEAFSELWLSDAIFSYQGQPCQQTAGIQLNKHGTSKL